MRRIHVSGWEKAITIATCIQTIVVVVTLIFISRQFDQQVNLSRAANAQAFVALGQPLNLKSAEPDTAKLWLKRGKTPGVDVTQTEIEEEQFNSLLSNYLQFYENVYIQHDLGLVNERVFRLWNEAVREFVLTYPIEKRWDQTKASYHDKLRTRVDEVLREKAIQPPTPTMSPTVLATPAK